MADAPEEEVVLDPIGKELDDQIKSNEALLRGLKYEFGQKLLQAQQGNGEPPIALEMIHIKKLEEQLRNDRMFREARNLTRQPDL